MSVKVSGVSKKYGEQWAVRDLSFIAQKGQILGFLGPNGAGKTTTMKMITGYLPATAGSIEVCGIPVADQPLEAAAKIGYLPEHNPLYKDMYVKEALQFVAGLHRVRNPAKRIQEMIAMTGLGLEQNKKIHQLSKGYRQRVGLAQAMIHDPEVLILDEPTSGLDPNQLKEIRSLILEIGKEKTVIFSTHIMQEVQALCQRVIIISRGQMVADDPIEKLQEKIGPNKVLSVTFDSPVSIQAIRAIPGVMHCVDKGQGTYEIQVNEDQDLRPVLFQWAVNQKAGILEMKQEQFSMEQIFQELTRQKA
jgi:ABC-2 type transport system ATP-binding protein